MGTFAKWIHCFEHVTAIIFVASLIDYNKSSPEDSSQNALIDSINEFEQIINSTWFEKTCVILFLNEKDKFATEIEKYPLTVCFEDYDGNNNYHDAARYIEQKFEKTNKNPVRRKIFIHMMSDHDSTEIRDRVFWDIQSIIVHQSMLRSGLIKTPPPH